MVLSLRVTRTAHKRLVDDRSQKVANYVKGGEADAHCNGPLHPVQTEALVEAVDEALFEDHLLHCA